MPCKPLKKSWRGKGAQQKVVGEESSNRLDQRSGKELMDAIQASIEEDGGRKRESVGSASRIPCSPPSSVNQLDK